jgi:DNA-directed RNA polymerase subunit M/transcription elongation factor TFIIS
MKIFSFAVVLLVIIFFSLDPNTSFVADTIYKLNYRDSVVSDDKDNKGAYNKAQNGEHLCLQCKSHFLTLEPSRIDREGEHVFQSIECRDCGFQWQEIWTLYTIQERVYFPN